MPANYPTVCPYVLYEDGAAALEWLKNAFGCTERMQGHSWSFATAGQG